jgi:hypothetical protein
MLSGPLRELSSDGGMGLVTRNLGYRVGRCRPLLAALISSMHLASLGGCVPLFVRVTPDVAGTVMDAASRQPISGALVYFAEFPEETVITSEGGEFVAPSARQLKVKTLIFDEFLPSSTLVVEAPGYRPYRESILYGDNRRRTVYLQSSVK